MCGCLFSRHVGSCRPATCAGQSRCYTIWNPGLSIVMIVKRGQPNCRPESQENDNLGRVDEGQYLSIILNHYPFSVQLVQSSSRIALQIFKNLFRKVPNDTSWSDFISIYRDRKRKYSRMTEVLSNPSYQGRGILIWGQCTCHPGIRACLCR